MIVVSDTSAISALIQIGHADILRQLFDEVLIPSAVEAELRAFHPELPRFIRAMPLRNPTALPPLLMVLDQGEAEAVALAHEHQADYLLMDEIAGRRVATAKGLRVIGPVGVLLEAKRLGLVPQLRPLIAALETQAGFHLSTALKAHALREAGELD